jgi:hypothetical protein
MGGALGFYENIFRENIRAGRRSISQLSFAKKSFIDFLARKLTYLHDRTMTAFVIGILLIVLLIIRSGRVITSISYSIKSHPQIEIC